MRALLRWWPALVVTSIVIVAGSGRFRAEEQTRQKDDKFPGDKEVISTVRKVIKQGANLYNARDHAGCYRYFEGSLTTMRPLLAKYPDLQKAVDSSLTEAEKNPSMSERGWILYRSLSRVYSNVKSGKASAGEKKADKASEDKKAKDKKGKGSKKKDAKKKKKKGKKDKKKDAKKEKDKAEDKPATDKKKSQEFDPQPPKDSTDDTSEKDKQGDDKDVPKDLLKDVKKADKPDVDKNSEGNKKEKRKVQAKAKVSGTIRIGDKPVVIGRITFHSLVGNNLISVPISPDAMYEVLGIPPGEYKISVVSPKPRTSTTDLPKDIQKARKDIQKARKDSKALLKKWVEIPRKYGDADKSGLRCTVRKGDNQFDLKLE